MRLIRQVNILFQIKLSSISFCHPENVLFAFLYHWFFFVSTHQ